MNQCPGISLIYRTLLNRKYVPDVISLTYGENCWYTSKYKIGRESDDSSLRTHRIEGIARYNFSDDKLLVPYWSMGIGYCWGTENSEY